MSARTLPALASTHSSILARQGSISDGRSNGANVVGAGIAGGKVAGDGPLIAPGQLCGGVGGLGQIERFEDLPLRAYEGVTPHLH